MADGTPDGFIPMSEAVRRLGKSDRTIRRLIERGELEGEKLNRPQGSVLFVKLPAEAAEDTASGGAAVSDQEQPSGGTQAALIERLFDALAAEHEKALDYAQQAGGYKERAFILELERDQLIRERDAARQAASE